VGVAVEVAVEVAVAVGHRDHRPDHRQCPTQMSRLLNCLGCHGVGGDPAAQVTHVGGIA